MVLKKGTKSFSKGGAKNWKKPQTDEEHLVDKLEEYIDGCDGGDPFALHEYTGLWSTCRPRIKSLVQMKSLLLVLLNVQPSCSIVYTTLRSTFLTMLVRKPELKPKNQSHMQYAKHLADKLVLAQKHLRALATDPSLIEKANLPKWHQQCIVDIIQHVDTPGHAKPPRALQREHSLGSECSVDSDGLPKLHSLSGWAGTLASDDVESDLLAEAAMDAEPLPPTKLKIKKAKLRMKKPEAAPGSLGIMKKPSAKKTSKIDYDAAIDCSKLKVHGPFTEKSYIVEAGVGHVCTVHKKQIKDHHALIKTIHKFIIDKSKVGIVTRNIVKEKRLSLV